MLALTWVLRVRLAPRAPAAPHRPECPSPGTSLSVAERQAPGKQAPYSRRRRRDQAAESGERAGRATRAPAPSVQVGAQAVEGGLLAELAERAVLHLARA